MSLLWHDMRRRSGQRSDYRVGQTEGVDRHAGDRAARRADLEQRPGVGDFRALGWLIEGVRGVCQRQAELLGGDTLSVFETAPDNGSMRRFMERQLKPYSEWTYARYLCETQIAVPVPEPSAA